MVNGDPLYINSLQRSTVFACADTFTLRHPTHHTEWQPRFQNDSILGLSEWKQPNVLVSLHMVNISHLALTYFTSRYSDMSTHFDAPRRIRSFYSSPLDQEQWKLEVNKIFATELALLQLHILGIAQGVGHDLPKAKNLLAEFGIDANGKVLFPAPGSKNVKIVELMAFLSACAACWILSIECEDGRSGKALWLSTTWRSISALWIEPVCLWLRKTWRKRVSGKLCRAWDQVKNVNYDDICTWLDTKLGLS
ncbi:hypothetical protein BKA66DRAFT_306052 [Pyrenochaeta sp. MPI-SDFR-AT-0127]|nr:hypothetical protein BKA66DRAFT_306052 [Pyrenochaeta sp. MPI-SDFR-AT-0127]